VCLFQRLIAVQSEEELAKTIQYTSDSAKTVGGGKTRRSQSEFSSDDRVQYGDAQT
jgi:hypothetical protein